MITILSKWYQECRPRDRLLGWFGCRNPRASFSGSQLLIQLLRDRHANVNRTIDENNELIPAPACRGAGTWQRGLDSQRYLAEQFVSGKVAVFVVDGLKSVEVDHDQTAWCVLLLEIEPEFLQSAAIEQTRQGVAPPFEARGA